MENLLNEKPCYAGCNNIAINSKGEVVPCITFRYILGNLKDVPLKEILSNEKSLYIKNVKIKEIKQCKDCKYLRCCSICLAYFFSERGHLYPQDSLICHEMHVLERAGLLD